MCSKLIRYVLLGSGMANQDLVNYISSLHTTASRERITRVLLDVGWAQTDIDDAFATVEHQNAPLASESRAGSAIATFVVVALAVLGLFALSTGHNPTGNVVGVTPASAVDVVTPVTEPHSEVTVIEEVQSKAVDVQPDVEPVITINATNETNTTGPKEDCSAGGVQACILKNAVDAKDERICNTMDDVTLRVDCVTQVAIAKQQKEVCHNVVNKDGCYATYAAALDDGSACGRIVSTPLRDACIAGLA